MAPSEIEKHITDQTACILPVHLYGKQADMKAFSAIAKKHGLKIIEDFVRRSAKTFGLGAYGDGLVLSFFNPYKNLGVCGKASHRDK
ncbi:DegT/DnrJ/EryC1/StrS family aminotransferase [Bacillus sp. SL00103]